MFNNIDSELYAQQIASSASNLRTGGNPSFTVTDFLAIYPQFGTDSQGKKIVPIVIIQMHIDMAQASIKQLRFRASWMIAISYFVAHFCILWLRSAAIPDDGVDKIVESGYTEGIITSSSVDGVSYTMDISAASGDLDGYAGWKSTSFGVQLATLAKMYGKGGMVVR